MPTPRNDVMTRSCGFSSSSAGREPMWSKSVWVSQIHRRSAGSITDCSAVRNSPLPPTVPVSTRIGSTSCSTKALMASEPRVGMSAVVLMTSTPGVAVKQAVTVVPPSG